MKNITMSRLGGFTLIELLVVVLIIGILAAIAVPQYEKAVVRARVVEAQTTLNALQKGIDAYYLANGYVVNKSDLPELLDIDVTKMLVCSNQGKCTSKDGKVGYTIWGGSNDYFLSATFYLLSPGDYYSQLTLQSSFQNGQWTNSCVTTTLSPLADSLCNSLKGTWLKND